MYISAEEIEQLEGVEKRNLLNDRALRISAVVHTLPLELGL